ncbi:MAG: ComEC/Rec2 family competence protein [Chloroflexi bacterium]|nr:ComEC/Rec2 family competence protein [Chloroflexota bacterium]
MPRPAWLAVGAAAGALALAEVSPLAMALIGSAILVLAASARAGGRAGAPRGFVPLAIGIVAIGLRAGAGGPPPPSVPVPSGEGPWTGIVESVGAVRDGSRPATVRLEGEPPFLVAATLPWYPSVVPADRVQLRGRIRAPSQDDYGAYLARIGAMGTIRADALEVLPATGTAAGTLEGLRRAASAGLEASMPEPEAGLAAGVLIGLRDRVDRDLAAAFTTASASHVVAISGWNIAIVASTLAALAGGMRRRRRAILTAAAIVVYVVFVGPSPSVVRAAVMAGVALLARELGRPGTAAAALGWACAVLLLIDPGYVDDAGFRLSVLATAGILAWGTSLTARLAGPAPGRPRRWIAEILGVSFAAQAATTPVVLLEFGRLSLVAPAVNLLVVPLVPPAMATGALALVAGTLVGVGLPGVVATIVGLPAWVLYAAMVGVVRAGASLPLASLTLQPPWDLACAAASLAVIVVVARWGDRLLAALRGPRVARPGSVAAGPTRAGAARSRHGSGGGHSRARRLAAVALVGATIGLALVVVHRPDGVVRITVLDVGQGDGILVESGRGGRMVVDGGPDPNRLLIALDERLPPWDRRIDILVLTHPHEDHVAGLAAILRRYRVGRVYEPGMIGPGPGYRAWAAVFDAGGPPHGRLSTGDRLALDQIAFRVLWPDANRVPLQPPDSGTSINNVSIVLLGQFDQHRFLLAGDVEEGVDPELLARGVPTVDLLKVAHHGSRTASTEAFLEAVRPRVAVVSVGAGNPYGHPAPSTIERLRATARETFRTDTDGSVEVAFDGPAIRVRTSGPRATQVKTTSPPAGSASAGAAGSPVLAALLCGIPPSTIAEARPPTAPEAPVTPLPLLGRQADARQRLDAHAPGRLPDRANWHPIGLGYHRADGDTAGFGDRAGARNRSPRLLLGRRRIRPGCRAGSIPRRPGALPGRPARALAARDRSRRTRPPPR